MYGSVLFTSYTRIYHNLLARTRLALVDTRGWSHLPDTKSYGRRQTAIIKPPSRREIKPNNHALTARPAHQPQNRPRFGRALVTLAGRLSSRDITSHRPSGRRRCSRGPSLHHYHSSTGRPLQASRVRAGSAPGSRLSNLYHVGRPHGGATVSVRPAYLAQRSK